MDFYKRELLVGRIIEGYQKYKINDDLSIYIYTPDHSTKYLAQEKYVESFESSLQCGVQTEDDTIEMMKTLGLWSNHLENLIKVVIPKHIEDTKVDLYKSCMDSNRKDSIRQELRKAEARYSELINKRHQFDYITCGGIATYHKLNFIIANSTKFEDGKLYDWADVDIHTVTSFVNNSTISDKDIRELARTEPWHSIWNASQKCTSVFGKSAIQLSDEQRKIIGYSLFYDQIYEHPECPHDTIVEDDDMLDGWIIIQKREKDKGQNNKMVESKITNPDIANSDEIFVVVNNDEEAQRVEKMNNTMGKMIKKQRLNKLKDKDEVIDTDFVDIRNNIAMKQNQEYVDKIKRR